MRVMPYGFKGCEISGGAWAMCVVLRAQHG